MRNRRTSSSPPLLLLSFQDIITAVTAIFLLCTLSLTLDLLRRGSAETPSPEQAEVDTLRERLESLLAKRDVMAASTAMDKSTLDSYLEHGVSGLKTRRDDLRRTTAQLDRKLIELKSEEREVSETADRTITLSSKEAARLKGQLEDATRRAEEDERKLNKLRASNALVYNPSSTSGRRTWLVDLAGNRISAVAVDDPATRRRLDSGVVSWLNPFRAWLMTRSRSRDLFMVLIRPSGIDRWESTEELLRSGGYAYGYDLIAENQQIMLNP